MSAIGPLCATAKMRPATRGEYGEYLVYCSYDRNDWRAFVVFPALNQVIGLSTLFLDIPPPGNFRKKEGQKKENQTAVQTDERG
jgi:hypothetical protein